MPRFKIPTFELPPVFKSPKFQTYRTGDILITASDTPNSHFIRGVTCSPVSHAALMIDEDTVIEAVPPRVKLTPLTDIISESSVVGVLRHQHLVHSQALKIVDYAMAQLNKPYDLTGATNAGVQSGCNGAYGVGPLGMMVGLVNANLDVIVGAKVSFFCTELVGLAFESVGMSLSSKAPWLTVPGGYLVADQLELLARIK